MQSALIAHSGPPSVAASSVHGGDSAAVATAAAASEVDLIQSAVDLVSQGWKWDLVHILSVLSMHRSCAKDNLKLFVVTYYYIESRSSCRSHTALRVWISITGVVAMCPGLPVSPAA